MLTTEGPNPGVTSSRLLQRITVLLDVFCVVRVCAGDV